MKKTICIICFFAVLFSFCSCSESPISKNLTELLTTEKNIDWDNFSSEKITDKGSLYKIYFDRLSENQKKAYNNIFDEILNADEEFPQRIEVPSMTGDELSQVYEAVVYDNPEIMCFGKGASIITEGDQCYFEPEYTMTPEEQRNRISLLNEVADKLKPYFTEDMSDFDKELLIHDFLVRNCSYDCDNEDSGLAFSCIVNGSASCEGYAKATKFLLEKSGIECYNILGDAQNLEGKTETHMWNLVKIDGSYYYLDTTWDDPADDSQTVSHIYFNLTENEIKIDHSNFQSFFPCESTNANYFVKTESLFYSSDYDSLQKMQNIVLKNLRKNRKNIELRFATKEAYNDAMYALITESKAYTIQENIKTSYPDIQMSDEINYSKNDNYNILEFIF